METDDYDSAWKEAIARYLADFLLFFFPRIAEDIDWSRPPKFLDKELYRLLDWVLALTPELEKLHHKEVVEYEKESKMPRDITAIERFGIEKGREEGRQEGLRSVALRMSNQGFTLEQIAQATEVSVERIQAWLSGPGGKQT